MNAIKAVAGWAARHALLFALIIAALVAHSLWSDRQADKRARNAAITAELAGIDSAASRIVSTRREAAAAATAAARQLTQYQAQMRGASLARLTQERARTRSALAAARAAMPTDFAVTRQLLARDTEALGRTALARVDLARLERQLAFLDESIAIARGNSAVLARIADLDVQLREATALLARHEQACRDAARDLAAFDAKRPAERIVRELLGQRRALVAEQTSACAQRDRAQSAKSLLEQRIGSGRQLLEKGAARIDSAITADLAAIDELALRDAERRAVLTRQLAAARGDMETVAARYQLPDKARAALLILLGIILAPYLIRTLFYYVIAPLAEGRGTIRIAVQGADAAAPIPAASSHISLPVNLEAGQELLVRQDYLQTSPVGAEAATRWLLDYRHPLSSLASGLYFLTRLRGGGMTAVSAVRDPFAELARIDLSPGAACVLHPRALVAIVQPVGRTMRITSHWRLFSLSAWLTLQLRFFVFHGPGSLIVRGGRGVRIEPAATGRIFRQDQLVGFSADLAYSVIRTETFAPYLFGREELFKDRVEAGTGVLIIEEAPFAGRRGGGARHGLEGALDAGLKALGL